MSFASFPKPDWFWSERALIPEYLVKVKEAIAEHGLENRVLVTGHRADAARFYAAADAFVLPSLFEGWSLAMAEAIMAGLPVVATSVGSATDLLPQIGGRLIRPPFGAITNLDYLSLNEYGANEDPAFVEDIAAAMKDVCRNRSQSAGVRRASPRVRLPRGLQAVRPVVLVAVARRATHRGTVVDCRGLGLGEALPPVQTAAA